MWNGELGGKKFRSGTPTNSTRPMARNIAQPRRSRKLEASGGISGLRRTAAEREQAARALLDEEDDEHQHRDLAEHRARERFEELVDDAESHRTDERAEQIAHPAEH